MKRQPEGLVTDPALVNIIALAQEHSRVGEMDRKRIAALTGAAIANPMLIQLILKPLIKTGRGAQGLDPASLT